VSTNKAEFERMGQPEPSATSSSPRRAAIARIGQWFWAGSEEKEARASAPQAEPALARRARVAAEIARRTLESPEPFADSILGPVAELYRQSIHWSLLALSVAPESAGNAEASTPSSRHDWRAVDTRVLARAIPDPDDLRAAQRAVDSSTFDELANLPAEEQAKLADILKRLALALLAELDLPQRVMEALWVRRAFRFGALLAVLVVGLVALGWLRDSREQARDLAQGRPWHASSSYALAAGCKSPLQECPDGTDYFFHTEEEQNPWLELDLGSTQQISAIRVINRKDCCAERAAPLVVEVSTDHKVWKLVARRDATFSSWLGEFAPTPARWVRLKLEKRAFFHLARVRVLR
jgi:hypothetical protein